MDFHSNGAGPGLAPRAKIEPEEGEDSSGAFDQGRPTKESYCLPTAENEERGLFFEEARVF